MDLNLLITKAKNELEIAKILFKLSSEELKQKEVFNISKEDTFYSAVITHAYYCIFYSAKTYLLDKGIKLKAPEEHRKTYEKLREFVKLGILDVELLRLYEKVLIKAETLLEIFKFEKSKRGKFTYRKLAQANVEPAQESLDNAKTFFKHIYNLIF